MHVLTSNQEQSQEILFGGLSGGTNIFIETNLHTHIYVHTCFFIIYTHTFLFDKLYIYTHLTTTKNLVFSIKIMFDSYLS